MVNNFDRILKEIKTEADRICVDNNLPAESLTELVMKIVEAEDRNRIKPFSVNKDISGWIADTAIKAPME